MSHVSEPGVISQSAIEMGLAKIKSLVAAGADVNKCDEYGWTPLMRASTSGGYLTIVEFLIESNAEVCFAGEDGFTALHAAAKYGDVHVARTLVENGALINAKAKDGWTPLSFAKYWTNEDECSQELVNYLIDKGGIDGRPEYEQGETAVGIVRAMKNRRDRHPIFLPQ